MPDPKEACRTAQYVVWVDFEIDPAQMADFEGLLRENVRATLSNEPGCRRFDVLIPESSPSSISLYEIYDDEAAFTAHLESDHYRSFATAAAPTIRAKSVRSFHLQQHAASETP